MATNIFDDFFKKYIRVVNQTVDMTNDKLLENTCV